MLAAPTCLPFFEPMPWLRIRGLRVRFRTVSFQNKKPRKPMIAITSGTPIPTPMAVGRLVRCFWVWAGTGGYPDVLAEEDAKTAVAFELGPAEKAVVTGLLEIWVGADGGGVTGGKPKMEPPVFILVKLALMPV